MITYIKYPIKRDYLGSCKVPMFCVCDKIERKENFIIVYPKTDIDAKGNVIYPKENKIGFYCKSLKEKEIMKFKGGFNVEKCETPDRVILARKWYFETKQDMPRKMKKRLIATEKRAQDFLKLLCNPVLANRFNVC
jgi:hypothetical protein